MHATERWADVVTKVLALDSDVRTLRHWAGAVGLSASALKARCQAAGVPAKASLDLARLLRALVLSRSEGCRASYFLDTVDPRTQRRLFRIAQLSRSQIEGPARVDLEEFIGRQHFVADDLPRQILCRALDLTKRPDRVSGATPHDETPGRARFTL